MKFSESCHRYSNLGVVSCAPRMRMVAMNPLIGSFHLWARLWGAKLRDRAIEKVDLVVEIDDC